MLQAHNITVSLTGRQVLHGVSLVARPGDITAIVGPNGSGKTTLLRALTGELAPMSGQVTLDGTALATLGFAALAQRRAVLPQSVRLVFPFTLQEVVAMGLSAGPSAARPEVLDMALSAVGLTGRGGQRFHQLSGGEQARGHLARALAQAWSPVEAGRASWLLLDEPVASLDIGQQLLVMRLAADYARRGGGVIAVMHDLNLTAMYAGQVILMQGGQVLARGTPAQVLTDATLSQAYHTGLRVGRVPDGGKVFVLPQAAI